MSDSYLRLYIHISYLSHIIDSYLRFISDSYLASTPLFQVYISKEIGILEHDEAMYGKSNHSEYGEQNH